MEYLKIALMLLVCSACTPPPTPQHVDPVLLPPPAGVWTCPGWPQEDELALPTTAEDVIQWHRVQRARDQLAFDACKADLLRMRDWARALGFGRGR